MPIPPAYTVSFVADGEVRAPATALFPTTSAIDWLPHPGLLDEQSRLTFTVGAYLLQGPDLVALIDLGLGPVATRTDTGATYDGGALPTNLAALGVAPTDVDLVVYTHLHRDHVGWTTTATPAGRALTFPTARHVVTAAEWEYWSERPSPLGPSVDTVLHPLSGRVELCVDGDELARGIHALATPGHTPGHLSLVVTTGPGRQVVLAGDCLHSPAQVTNPDWCFGSDLAPDDALRTRRRLLDTFGARLLRCAHFLDTPARSAATMTTGARPRRG